MELSTELIETAMSYAIRCHNDTNHKYSGQPYHVHLDLVYKYGCKYAHLLPNAEVEIALAACWTHDTIEDTRQSYNDVKTVCGKEVADVVYALTNEKGKNRKARANDKYYAGIALTPPAGFVKLCDRLANVKYSKMNNSSKFDMYKKENDSFVNYIQSCGHKEMIKELNELFS